MQTTFYLRFMDDDGLIHVERHGMRQTNCRRDYAYTRPYTHVYAAPHPGPATCLACLGSST